MAHTTRYNPAAREVSTMGFKIRRMPPHSKLLSDARDRETQAIAQQARKGSWSDDD